MTVVRTDDRKTGRSPVWARRLASRAGEANVAYCAGWDVRGRAAADAQLLPYDLWTNRAHCAMLAKVGAIPKAKLARILRALREIEKHAAQGKFRLRAELEDVHLNVERFVEEHEGVEVAGLMHTGRSRNDQVATDMRLWLRDRTLEFVVEIVALSETLAKLAGHHTRTLMPGLTHQQPAAWTTLGHWAAAHAFAFARDATALLDLFPLVNQSPLGAAASFGTSWPIDRAYAARLLGFDRPQPNSLDAVTNRAEPETRAAALLAVWAQHAATLAQDLILFSSPPWSLVRIGDAYVTGSSIMPQKRNPDFAEVTKAKAALAGSIAGALLDLTRGDPSGYNREQQWSKYLIMDLFAELEGAPTVLAGALESLSVDKRRMRTLMAHDYLEAADVADYLAQSRGIPFRKAYRWLGEAVRRSESEKVSLAEAVNRVLAAGGGGIRLLSAEEQRDLASAEWLLARRTSAGGPSPQSVRAQCAELRAELRAVALRRRRLESRIVRARSLLAQAMRRLG
jgi:argininosuccinate lyase